MKTFSNSTKKIKITFVCDACDVDTPMEAIEIPETCDINTTATCPVCFKEFEVNIRRTSEKSWIEIQDISDDDITVEEM